MDIATLAYKVDSSDLQQAEKSLDRLAEASGRTEKATEKMGRQWASTTARLAKAGLVSAAVAGVAAAAYGLARLRSAYGDVLDTIERADRLGWGTDNLSRLEFGARSAGVEVDELNTGIRNLTRFLVEAAKGGKEQSGLLKQLGIAAKEADGSLRPTQAVLRDIADVMPRIKDPTTRAALAMKIFGENGAGLLPLFEDGASGMDRWAKKSDELGYTLTEEAGAGAREAKKQMDALKLSMDALWRSSLTQLLPKLQDLAELLNSQDFRDGFATLIGGATSAVTALVNLASTTANVTKFLGEEVAARLHGPAFDDIARVDDELARIQKRMGELRKGAGFFSNPDPAFVRDAQERKGVVSTAIYAGSRAEELAFLEDYQKKLLAGSTLAQELQASAARIAAQAAQAAQPVSAVTVDWGAVGGGGGSGGGGRDRRNREAERTLREAQRLAEAQDEWHGRLLDMQADLAGPVAQVIRDHERQMSELERAYHAGEVALSDYATMQDLLTQSRQKELDVLDERLNPGRQLLDDLRFELKLLSMTNAERATAIQLRGMEADQVRKYGDEIAKLNREIEDQMRRTELVDGFRDSFREAVSDVLKGTESIGNAIERMVDRINAMILDRIAGNFTDFLFGQQGQAGGGQWGQILGAVAGLFGGGRASGGDVRGDRIYRVGEGDQPELLNLGRGRKYVIPGDAGRVEPIRGGGSRPSVTVHAPITVDGRTDRRTAARIAQEIVVKGRTAMVRNGGGA